MFLYNIIIQPLVLIIEIFFVIFYDLFGVPAVAIILLSIFVNFLTLPLYKKADSMQKAERLHQQKLKPGADHIKKTFSGDEQFMILSTYYKLEHYSPFSVLKESFPLLLQIPIFIAAFRYLSSTSILSDAQFGPITDLGSPDKLLTFGNITINLLPIIMTLLNVASGMIYTKGLGIRLKIQIFSIAALFLILLYNSPSGLVLYWTVSQLFSLAKNLFIETNILKKQKLLLTISISTIVLVLILQIYISFQTTQYLSLEILSKLCLIPAFIYIINYYLKQKNLKLNTLKNIFDKIPEIKYTDYIAVCFSLFLLLGICIPASVISASVSEFLNTSTGEFQSYLLTYPISVYAGLFLLWTSVYYYFTEKHGRKLLFGLMIFLLSTGIINYFIFDLKPEFYYSDLTFDGKLSVTSTKIALNIIVSAVTVILLFIIWIKRERYIKNIVLPMALSLLVLGGYHIIKIPKILKQLPAEEIKQEDEYSGILSLSKNGKNVIVLMMDKAIGGQLPFIFDEFPEFKDDYDGFVYYPNTISFERHTMNAALPIMGGYEYTPHKLIDHTEIKDKDVLRTEAMRVLPVLFNDNGYKTIICDTPVIGPEIYSDYPDISTYTLQGHFNKHNIGLFETNIATVQKRNFLMFSIYKTSPILLRDVIYDDGYYMQAEVETKRYNQPFIDSYSALSGYADLTEATDSDQGSFIFISNNLTHEPTPLSPPDYAVTSLKQNYEIPYGTRSVDGKTMSMHDFDCWAYYSVNVITYREIAKWLNTLKELDVYDNTRIIIVSDHGSRLDQFEELELDGFDAEGVNSILLVKDFDSHGAIKTNTEFMTNGDVPILAVQDLIDNPVNPFTGNVLTCQDKIDNNILIAQVPDKNLTALKIAMSNAADYTWWSVKGDIFDKRNWVKLSE